MKEKFVDEIYMREVLEKEIKIKKNEELNSYITFKKIIKTSSPCRMYINGKKVIIVDNGYTIIEYSPLDKKYNVRLFIDNNKNILLYYFDIINSSRLINNRIYIEDLYLDVIVETEFSNNLGLHINLVDENELIDALNNKKINNKQFDMAYNEANKLMKEIVDNKNIFINRGIKDYIDFL